MSEFARRITRLERLVSTSEPTMPIERMSPAMAMQCFLALRQQGLDAPPLIPEIDCAKDDVEALKQFDAIRRRIFAQY